MYKVVYEEKDWLPFVMLVKDWDIVMWDFVFSTYDVILKLKYFILWIEMDEHRKKDLTITTKNLEWLKDYLSNISKEGWKAPQKFLNELLIESKN